MDELRNVLKIYKDKNKLNDDELAKNLNLNNNQIKEIEDGTANLNENEIKELIELIQSKNKSSGKKVIKILDLIFRFVAMIMPLVALLLCINNYTHTNAIIILLSIGVIASSIMTLPRNEK